MADTTGNSGGARVAMLRKARGLSQLALARRAGVSLSLLSKIDHWYGLFLTERWVFVTLPTCPGF
jgi:hypothetical protein